MKTDTTFEQYRCYECLHTGPALGDVTEQHHGDGAHETLLENLRCEDCDSERIYELHGADFEVRPITDICDMDAAERLQRECHEAAELARAALAAER